MYKNRNINKNKFKERKINLEQKTNRCIEDIEALLFRTSNKNGNVIKNINKNSDSNSNSYGSNKNNCKMELIDYYYSYSIGNTIIFTITSVKFLNKIEINIYYPIETTIKYSYCYNNDGNSDDSGDDCGDDSNIGTTKDSYEKAYFKKFYIFKGYTEIHYAKEKIIKRYFKDLEI